MRHTEREARSVFLTGGTGFLGSHLTVALLKKGHRVSLLARSRKQQTAGDRVRVLLDWFDLPGDHRRRLRIIEGDITMPGLGVAPAVLSEVLQQTDEIVHCASSTAFSERKRAELERVNLFGLSQVLECARSSAARLFHHVSTAFVAGRVSGRCPEEPATPRGFHNPYEETKCRGEQMAIDACREMHLPLSIYRPSIVYGDSRTGRSLLFNALYHPVRTALFIKGLYEKDILERGGRKADEMGVRMEPDGTLSLPLRIEAVPEGGINLIPVDYFTDAFLGIMDAAPDGGIFHIVDQGVTRVEQLIDYTCRLFRVAGIRACEPEAFAAAPRNAIEMLFDRYVEPYVPYMSDRRRFQRVRSAPLIERNGTRCPQFDYDMFARCMSFAVASDWHSPLETSELARQP